MQIDAVVPAYNAGAYIDRCIEGLLAAGFDRSEIVIVDDGSTDDTVSRIKAHGLTPLRQAVNTSASAARNAGAAHGSAEVILFVDADVVVAPDARAVLVEFLNRHPDCDAVFGAYDDTPDAPERISRIRNLLHRHVHLENAGPAVTFWSGCGAVRRTAFEAVGGFDESLSMMEDVDLGLRLTIDGAKIVLVPELQGKHLKKWSLIGLARTDLFNRAVPWARLLARPDVQALPSTLNISATSRASVLAVAASLAGALALPFAPRPGLFVIVLAIATIAIANRTFLRTLARGPGVLDSIVAIPVLWVHYFCGGLGFAWVKLTG